MMRRSRQILKWAVATALFLLPAAVAPGREVDDSYSIAGRFEQYKNRYPGIAWPAVDFGDGQSVFFDQSYKQISGRTLAMDVFVPPAGKRSGSAILLVHGGAWRSGSKAHFYALASRLAKQGHTVFLPEFRLAPEAPYPAGMVDIADALGWVHSQTKRFNIHSDQIAVGGASSGGQMASLLAFAGSSGLFGEAGRKPIAGLVVLDGVLDFTDPLALQFENAAGPLSPAAKWLGGSFEQKPEVWAEASAAQHVSPRSPPTLILGSGIARFTAGRQTVLAELARHGIAGQANDMVDAPHDFWLFEPWITDAAKRMNIFLNGLGSPDQKKAKP